MPLTLVRRAATLCAVIVIASSAGGCRLFAGYDSAQPDGGWVKDGALDQRLPEEGTDPRDRDGGRDGATDAPQDGNALPDTVIFEGGSADAALPPVTGACSTGGWCWENQRPTGNDLTAVAGLPAGGYLVVGEAATILHFDGAQWTSIPRPINTQRQNLTAIWATSLQDFAVAGEGGTVWVRENGVWTDVSSSSLGNITGIWSGTGHLWVSSSAGLYHHGGSAWTTKVKNVALAALWAASATEGFAVVDDQVYRFSGATFACSNGGLACGTNKQLQTVWGLSANQIYAGSVDGCIYEITQTTCKAIWKGQPNFAQVLGLWGSGPQDMVAVGFKTRGHFNGTVWTWDQSFAEAMGGVGGHVSRPGYALGAGSRGRLYGYGPLGGWRRVNEDLSATWLQSVAELGGELWAGGGELRRRDTQGRWQPLAGPGNGQIIAMGGTGPNAAWLLRAPSSTGQIGTLLYGHPGSFQSVATLPTSFDPQSLFIDANGVAWTAGHDSQQPTTRARLFKLNGPTATPSEISVDSAITFSGRVQGLWVRTNGDLFLVTDGGTLATRTAGFLWKSKKSGAYHALWADDTLAVAVGRSGTQGWAAVHDGAGWTTKNILGMPLNDVFGGGNPRRIYAVGDAE